MEMTADIIVFVVPTELSDKSVAYDVRLCRDRRIFATLAATTESDAISLADKIADAINEHTVNNARVEREY